MLCSNSFPERHLLRLTLAECLDIKGGMPPLDEVEDRFRIWNWAVQDNEEKNEQLSAVVELPGHFPQGSSCTVTVEEKYNCNIDKYRRDANIYFHVGEDML